MNKLQKTGVAGIFCMALTGCATTQFAHSDNPCNEGEGLSFLFGLAAINNSKINESCSQDRVYKSLVETEDPGVQAVGCGPLSKNTALSASQKKSSTPCRMQKNRKIVPYNP